MYSWFVDYFPNVVMMPDKFVQSTLETLYMTFFSGLIGGIFGVLLAIMLVATQANGVSENKICHGVLDKLINLLRSIPFVILLALIYPITRFIVGTTVGLNAALVPLTVGFAPFFARQIQNALLEVDEGIVEAAKSMGSSPVEIIIHVYLKEGLPAIIRASAVSIISLIGLTAMAGAIGAGGLGSLAINIGYNGFKNDVAVMSTLIILVLVFITQWICHVLLKKVSH
ncbi:D-methionine transport system permease protein [Orbus hercynius]|uniref:D-methionine transport system permease protein n=1 Tax=Orbus hercynius TaxID=593135 RepID=A0A495RJA7_9GAMM|nr:methionine ABC transporter permease [Orbus hercynius]RKS87380.1 D-methionine transport system permease protein [Orbus hercynius]